MDSQLLTIKAKKLGVRLSNSRQKRGLSIETLSQWAGVTVEEFEQIERGEISLSLPQVEIVAYKLGLSFEELLNGEPGSNSQPKISPEYIKQYTGLQNRIIGVNIKKARIDKKLSLETIAEQCGITVNIFEQYESGTLPIPYPLMEYLCTKVGLSPLALVSQFGVFAKNNTEVQNAPAPAISNPLSDELVEFINNPANTPYLELAKRLSALDASKLRGIAEGLLEITY